jgi:hypothetical protein
MKWLIVAQLSIVEWYQTLCDLAGQPTDELADDDALMREVLPDRQPVRGAN